MAYLNKTYVIGRVVAQPELQQTAGGNAACNLTIACTRQAKNGNEKQEYTSFFDVTAYYGTAELLAKYATKGRSVLIEGSLVQNKWQDKNGNTRSRLYIYCERVQFLDQPASTRQPENATQQPVHRVATPRAGTYQGGTTNATQSQSWSPSEEPEDIPF